MKSIKDLNFNGYLFSFYRNRDYCYNTCENGELFLSFPKNFNDQFEGKVLVDKNEFAIEYCSRIFGEDFVLEFDKNVLGKDFFQKLEFLQMVEKNKFEVWEGLGDFNIYNILYEYGIDKLKQNILCKYNLYLKKLIKVRNRYGIACFSTIPPTQNVVLWAHYADNYKGFCVEYRLGLGLEEDRIVTYLREHIYKVKYTDKFKVFNVKKLLNIPVNKIEKNKEIHKYIKEILTIKQKQWAYEDEYRLIIDLEDKFLFKVKVCKKGFSIKFPYYQCVYGYDIPKDSKKYKALVSIGKKNNVLLGNLILSSQERALVIDQNSFLEECVGWYKSNHYFNS